ncbi:MAG TPA: DUF4381 domain-containing protein [Candidatus Binatia bacterium]|nr:DUF4381 domain-containing protein [Candidatus Binatia bacterium]
MNALSPNGMPNGMPAGLPQAAGGDALAGLRGLHLPDAIGWWPPAPGWWIVAAVLLASVAVAAIAWRRRRASVARRALRELDALARRPLDLHGLATAISELLRRVALVRFGSRVAGLHGATWQDFLSSHAGHRRGARSRAALAGDVGRVLALAPYAPPGVASFTSGGARIDRVELLAAARAWIRGNR